MDTHPTPYDNRSFWRTSGGPPYQTDVGLIGVSITAYWYIEVRLAQGGQNYSQAMLASIMSAFEDLILPRLHTAFGYEPRPPADVDGDPRVTILITTDVSVFDPRNERPAAIEPMSNEREMIYVQYQVDTDVLLSLLTHEFTHLIEWNYDPSEPGWIAEGLAQVAERVVGYETGDPPFYFENTSVGIWSGRFHHFASYGAWELFVLYLHDRFGGWSLTRSLTQNPLQGVAGVEDTLTSLGHATDFRSVFADWMVANLVNGEPGDDRFRYTNLTGRASVPYAAKGDSWSGTVPVENGGVTYVGISAAQSSPRLRIELSNVSADSIIAVLVIQGSTQLQLLEALMVGPQSVAIETDRLFEEGNATLAVSYLNISGAPEVPIAIQIASLPVPHLDFLPYALIAATSLGTATVIVLASRHFRRNARP